MAVDSAGNVYVSGSSKNTNNDHDFATVKYNAVGVEQWVARYNGPGNYNDGASSLVVTRAGMVYVTGSSYGESGDDDFATVKYDTHGSQLWVSRYAGQGNSTDYATQLVLDAQENVYVTGISGNMTATVKYDSAGHEEWVVTYLSRCPAIAADGIGGVCVAGIGGTYPGDFLTIRYAPATGTAEGTAVHHLNPAQTTLVRNLYRFVGERSASIFDINGIWVCDLHPGVNDVSQLSPGVYFAYTAPQATNLKPHTALKIVIQR